jgi:membrane protein implicated in regulation of membrane protease activity
MKRTSRWKRRLAGFSIAIVALMAVAGASALIIRYAPPWLVSTAGLTGAARLDELNRIRIALVLIVLGALTAAVVLLIARRASLDRREQRREHHLAQRFARAVDQLGHPALDVRLGGLYSLERLAQESPEDHVPIIEILAAFVREHAPWPPRVGAQSGDGHKLAPAASHPAAAPAALTPSGFSPAGAAPAGIAPAGMGPPNPETSSSNGVPTRSRPATDVQAAVTILGRRTLAYDSGAPISLPYTSLSGSTLTGAQFERAVFSGAVLEGADLFKANLAAADLEGANLKDAGLLLANLNEAVLWAANIEGARLYGANLEGAALKGANLKGAGLTGANLKDAGLHSAVLTGADLTGANLEGAGLEGANLEGADLQGANLKGAVLLGAEYDEATVWPEGFDVSAYGAVLVDG